MTIGIYGTGRFGRFWATALAQHARVITYSRTPREAPDGCVAGSLADIGACDAVMLCVAISAVDDALHALVPHLGSRVTVMDTCSVKVEPTDAMMNIVPEHNPVIGTHPMFGPDSAPNGVSGLPFVYTPMRGPVQILDRFREFFAGMGLRVIDMSADEHDRAAAMTQGVTHLLGRLLADMGVEASPIATVGYRKLLEVVEQTCNDPYQLFVDLQQRNPYTLQMRERLLESLSRLMAALSDDLTAE